MTSPTDKPRRIKNERRVVLSLNASAKTCAWLQQVQPLLRGIHVARGDIVSWYLEQAADQLTGQQIYAIRERFFDPVKSLVWLTREAVKARKSGQALPDELRNLLEDNRPKVLSQRKQTKKSAKAVPSSIPANRSDDNVDHSTSVTDHKSVPFDQGSSSLPENFNI